MTSSNGQKNELEDRLRDWGECIPNADDGRRLSFEDLERVAVNRNRSFQRTMIAGVMMSVVVLVSWIATTDPEGIPLLKDSKNSLVADTKKEETLQIDVAPTPVIENPVQTLIYTKLETTDSQLQERWVEAKRDVARERVLQQWLAENL
jgi:hypothetical protein